ncbi:hypothetical protein L6452_34869 [Arctium lappa]|uniref:Uncharacterized protein n=1 Tax=Arctium lappa TaxID=4217 RepID=A0ACB8YJM0_ARCLA|nr:hypothetical protein L6452_34869 [Arctium lappa]
MTSSPVKLAILQLIKDRCHALVEYTRVAAKYERHVSISLTIDFLAIRFPDDLISKCSQSSYSRLGAPFNLNDLLTAYSVQADNYHRYSLFPRMKGDTVLVHNTAVNDRGWKRQYVFMQVASVSNEDSQWLSSGWNESVIDFSRVNPRKDSLYKIQRILDRSITDRSFSPRSNDEGDETVSVAEVTSVEGSPREAEKEREENMTDAAVKSATAKRAEQLELARQGREKARKRYASSTGVDPRCVRGKQPRYSPKKTGDTTLSSLSGATLAKDTVAEVELGGSTKATKDAPLSGVSGVNKPIFENPFSSSREEKNKEKVGETIFKATFPSDFMVNDVLKRDVIFPHLGKFLLPTFRDRYKDSRVEDTGAHAVAYLSFYAHIEGLRAAFPDVQKRVDEAIEKEKIALEAVGAEKAKVSDREKINYRDRILELEKSTTDMEIVRIKATTAADDDDDEVMSLKKKVEELEGDVRDLEEENRQIEAFSRLTARAALMRHHLSWKNPMVSAAEELKTYLDTVGTERDLDEDDDLEGSDGGGEVAAAGTTVV